MILLRGVEERVLMGVGRNGGREESEIKK